MRPRHFIIITLLQLACTPSSEQANLLSSNESTPHQNYWTLLNEFTDKHCTTGEGCTFTATRFDSPMSTDTDIAESPQDTRYKISNAYSMESDTFLDLENINPNPNQRVLLGQSLKVPENWFELELSEGPEFNDSNQAEWQAVKKKSNSGSDIATQLLDAGKTKIGTIVKENGVLSAGVITKGSTHNFYGMTYIATFSDNTIKHPDQPPSYTLSFFHSDDVEEFSEGYVKIKKHQTQPHISFSGKNISENSFHITAANGDKYYFNFFGTPQGTSIGGQRSPKAVDVPSDVEYLKNFVINEMTICN